MFIADITNRGAAPALEATLAFNQAQLTMIAENVANYQTPHYAAQQLDVPGFQRALREALDQRGDLVHAPFEVRSGEEVRMEADGTLHITPTTPSRENLMFHDETNLSLERQMTELAKTAMSQQLATELLKGRFDGLRKAIRGTA